jgi:hypothetical protein
MAVEQREVYLLPFTFTSEVEDHLFIVLSVRRANEYENTFIAVMITSSERHFDDFSFKLSNEMFDVPLTKENSHARMHLLQLCMNEEIKGKRITKMKPLYFKQLMAAIGDLIFNYDFAPIA